MYALVLATLFTTGNDVPDFGRRGGCHGCRGCYGGCWGGCYGGCRGSCYGGCYGGCWGGCYGGYSSCYGGCFGCGGGCGGVVIYSGCCGGCGGMGAYSAGCTGGRPAASGGSRGGSGSGGQGGGSASQGNGGSAGQGTGGSAGQGGGASSETVQDLKELKKSLAELKKQQEQLRTDALKQVAEKLRLQVTDQKIDELRRAIEELSKRRPVGRPIPLPPPQPSPGANARPAVPLPAPQPGKVRLDMPAGVLLVVNGKPIAATSPFLTPPIQSGQEYVAAFEATATRSGQSITHVKRLTIRPGSEVRLAFADMKPAEEKWTKAETAQLTVRLPVDARLTVDEVECPLTSSVRTFDSPTLVPGREYYYVLKVEMMRDGRRIAQTKRVAFRAGERVAVSFEESQAERLTAR